MITSRHARVRRPLAAIRRGGYLVGTVFRRVDTPSRHATGESEPRHITFLALLVLPLVFVWDWAKPSKVEDAHPLKVLFQIGVVISAMLITYYWIT